jgi:hypothetical protein
MHQIDNVNTLSKSIDVGDKDIFSIDVCSQISHLQNMIQAAEVAVARDDENFDCSIIGNYMSNVSCLSRQLGDILRSLELEGESTVFRTICANAADKATIGNRETEIESDFRVFSQNLIRTIKKKCLCQSAGPCCAHANNELISCCDCNEEKSMNKHVNKLISDALNVENLSNMYEGWSPWL